MFSRVFCYKSHKSQSNGWPEWTTASYELRPGEIEMYIPGEHFYTIISDNYVILRILRTFLRQNRWYQNTCLPCKLWWLESTRRPGRSIGSHGLTPSATERHKPGVHFYNTIAEKHAILRTFFVLLRYDGKTGRRVANKYNETCFGPFVLDS